MMLFAAPDRVMFQCGSLLEDQEEYLEEWFFNRQDTDIFEELCVNELER